MSVRTTTKSGQCSWCYQLGHDANNCPGLKRYVSAGDVRALKFQKRLDGTSGRLCGYCGHENHSSVNCTKRFNDFKAGLIKQKDKADNAFSWLKEIGFGPGAMLSGMSRESSYRSRNKDERIVVIEEFSAGVASQFFKELFYGTQRNWYRVSAVDSTNERVRNIYLPFHPIYAPRPTSMKVSVVHRANDEDIESMKKFVPALNNPVMDYDTAEQFFSAGYKFKSGNTKYVEIDDSIIKINNRFAKN